MLLPEAEDGFWDEEHLPGTNGEDVPDLLPEGEPEGEPEGDDDFDAFDDLDDLPEE